MRRGTRARARRSTPRSTLSPTSSSPGTPARHPQVCPPLCGQPRMQRAQLSVGPAAARARERDRSACCRRTRARARRPLLRLPQLRARREARRPPRATQLALAIGTCERAATPVLLTAFALLSRCRQLQLRALGLDGHRALDIFGTTIRRDVDTTVTRIRPPARPRALPHGPGGAKPVPVSRARSSSRLRPRRRALLVPLTIECSAVGSGLIIHAMTATTSTTVA